MTQAKAMRLVKEGRVEITWSDDVLLCARVHGDTDSYLVQIAWTPDPQPSCECVAWLLRRKPCSHLLAVEYELGLRQVGVK